MDNNTNNGATTKFMLAEYQDLYQNVMHLENKLFNHLSFYTTLFMGIVTASIAIIRLFEGTSSSFITSAVLIMLSVLFGVFVIVGRFELRMTAELRIRKIKFVEGITQVRQYFVDKDQSIADYLVLPVGLRKAPPYLRVRSKDWYQVLYISLMNGLAALIAWTLLLVAGLVQIAGLRFGWIVTVLLVPVWLLLAGLISYVFFWVLSYRSVMDFCESYDNRREEREGRSEYDLFERPLPGSCLRWTFGDWIWWIEKRRQARHGQQRSSPNLPIL